MSENNGFHPRFRRENVAMDRLLQWLGRRLAKYLSTPLPEDAKLATSTPEKLAGALQPGDGLLIAGHTPGTALIKYLTQSTWSHTAIYVGERLRAIADDRAPQ